MLWKDVSSFICSNNKEAACPCKSCKQWFFWSWKQPQMNEVSQHDSWQKMVIPGHRFDLSHLGFGHSTIFEPGRFTFSHLEFFILSQDHFQPVLSFSSWTRMICHFVITPLFFHLRPECFFRRSSRATWWYTLVEALPFWCAKKLVMANLRASQSNFLSYS